MSSASTKVLHDIDNIILFILLSELDGFNKEARQLVTDRVLLCMIKFRALEALAAAKSLRA